MKNNTRGSNIKNIRTYIMGLIYRNGFSSVRVPSSMELARKFGVTRRTARMALEGLIAENFLIGKNGVGTFTNPKRGFKLGSSQQKKLVGLCFGDGSFFYYDLYSGIIFAELMTTLLEAGYNVYPFVHTSVDPEALIAEMENAGIDAAIFCNPPLDFIPAQRFATTGRPCVTLRNMIPGIDCVRYDYSGTLAELILQAAAEKRRRLALFISKGSFCNYPEEFRQAVETTGMQSQVEAEFIDVTPDSYEQALDELFSRKEQIPGTVVLCWRAPQAAREAMLRHGVTAAQCRLVADCECFSPDGIAEYGMGISKTEAARAALRLLEERFLHPELPPQILSLQGKIIHVNDKQEGNQQK